MSRLPRPIAWLVVLALVTSALYVPKVLFPDAAFYETTFTGPLRHTFAAAVKLAGLAAGAVFAARAAWGLERGNLSRGPWGLVGAGLFASFAGQLVFSYFVVLRDEAPPIPSLGDALFLSGYLALIVALFGFVFAYQRSGLPLGSPRAHVRTGLLVGLVGGGLGLWVLSPIATAPAPLAERLTNLAYPALDILALVPTAILLRMTRRLAGGRIATVWGTLLLGLVLLAAGDAAYAYFSIEAVTRVVPLFDLLFMNGYALVAAGAAMQVAMQED